MVTNTGTLYVTNKKTPTRFIQVLLEGGIIPYGNGFITESEGGIEYSVGTGTDGYMSMGYDGELGKGYDS